MLRGVCLEFQRLASNSAEVLLFCLLYHWYWCAPLFLLASTAEEEEEDENCFCICHHSVQQKQHQTNGMPNFILSRERPFKWRNETPQREIGAIGESSRARQLC